MARYTPDRRSIGRYLQHDRDLKRELHRRAILGQGAAVAAAPRRTGELASSSEVQDDGPNSGVNHDRMSFSIHFTARQAVPVTYPRRSPDQRDYLEAAIQVMQRGS